MPLRKRWPSFSISPILIQRAHFNIAHRIKCKFLTSTCWPQSLKHYTSTLVSLPPSLLFISQQIYKAHLFLHVFALVAYLVLFLLKCHVSFKYQPSWVIFSDFPRSGVIGNSLAVQWPRLCAFTPGGLGSIPGWELRSESWAMLSCSVVTDVLRPHGL